MYRVRIWSKIKLFIAMTDHIYGISNDYAFDRKLWCFLLLKFGYHQNLESAYWSRINLLKKLMLDEYGDDVMVTFCWKFLPRMKFLKNQIFKHRVYLIFFGFVQWGYGLRNCSVSELFKLESAVLKNYCHTKQNLDCRLLCS